MSFTVSMRKDFPVRYLKCVIGVRYWEDAEVNGVKEEDCNPSIPLRNGLYWEITIDLETGIIKDWPKATTAKVYYKACDAGMYYLLDEAMNVVKSYDGYVPNMLSPKENGYGDYVILDIDANGHIDGWRVDLKEFDDD